MSIFCTLPAEHLFGLFPELFPFPGMGSRWYARRFLHPDIVALCLVLGSFVEIMAPVFFFFL